MCAASDLPFVEGLPSFRPWRPSCPRNNECTVSININKPMSPFYFTVKYALQHLDTLVPECPYYGLPLLALADDESLAREPTNARVC